MSLQTGQSQSEVSRNFNDPLNDPSRDSLKDASFGNYSVAEASERRWQIEGEAKAIVRPALSEAGKALTSISEKHEGLNSKAVENSRRAYHYAINQGIPDSTAKAIAHEAWVHSDFSAKASEVERAKKEQPREEAAPTEDLFAKGVWPSNNRLHPDLIAPSRKNDQNQRGNPEKAPPLERLHERIGDQANLSNASNPATPYEMASNSLKAGVTTLRESAQAERAPDNGFSWQNSLSAFVTAA